MPRIDLSQFDEAYEKATVEDRSFDEIPDGKYQVNVEKVELRTSKKGNAMLSWELKVLIGEHAGRRLFRNNVLATEENAKFLKQDLHTCGLQLDKLSDLNARLHELLDLKLDVQKKTKPDGNVNVWLNRRIVLDDDVVPF